MKNEDFITIQGWMVNELKLAGNELLAYAVIYGFSKDGITEYKGSSKYLSEVLNVSKNTAINTLNSLTKKQLIVKRTEEISGVTFNRYAVNMELLPYTKNWSEVYQKLVAPLPEIGTSNYIGNNKGNNKEIDISTLHSDISLKENPKTSSKRFVKPSLEEVRAYCAERGNRVNPESFINYYESNGWLVSGKAHMKDWKASVRYWEANQKTSSKTDPRKDVWDSNRKLEW